MIISTTIRYEDEKTMQPKVKTYKCGKDKALAKFNEYCRKKYGHSGCMFLEIKQTVF